MKKKIFSFLIGTCVIGQFVIAQTSTIVLQPNSSQGKDACIASKNNTTNFGNNPDFPAVAWTNGGSLSNARGLLEFDLSAIPNGATISSAKLSLYSFNSPSNGSHSTMSGSNESLLRRITSPWNENTVTWDNQPSTTTVNQVTLPASTNAIQHYLDINVTNLIQDMINDPSNSHGFLIQLVTEQYYRRMVFASSDASDTSLHPKLEVTYTNTTPVNCLTLRPGVDTGKDACIVSKNNTTNFGNNPDFPAVAWTNGGSPSNARGLLEFDLSAIPNGATISSAKLSLYSFNSPSNGSHSTMSGSNESLLRRITSPWNENTVTWDNQPSTTTVNQVTLPASTNAIQHYLDINVTNLIQDMINDPSNSHGFLIQLVTEQYYRRMVFASSDASDTSLHPKLEICYIPNQAQTSEKIRKLDREFEMRIYPNPSSDFITLDLSDYEMETYSIEIVNSTGQTVSKQKIHSSKVVLDISSYPKGIYFIKVSSNNFIKTEKVIFK